MRVLVARGRISLLLVRGKKHKASGSQGFQSPGHPGQGQARDCPQRQGSQDFGTAQSQSAVGQERTQFVPPPPSMDQGNQYQFQGATPASSTS